MHSAVLFISKENDSLATEFDVTDEEMQYRGADYWGTMYQMDEVMTDMTEGDVPMFVPVGNGKYTINQAYADKFFEQRYNEMMGAIAEIQKKGLKEFSSFCGMGLDVYRLRHAYSDEHGFLVKGDDDDFGMETQADFLRWDRHCLEKEGKAHEYYIRGMMDYHF